jgi:hypothetical protein
MQVVDDRRDIKGQIDVCLKCRPVFGTDEMTAPISAPRLRQFKAGTSYPVDIKLRFQDRVISMKTTRATPSGCVELQARIQFGVAVEFEQPKPTSWAPGRVYQMRRVSGQSGRNQGYRMTSASGNVTVRMTMRYSNVRVTIPNVVVPRTAAARDVISAWWRAVEATHIVDPNILCLSRDPEAFDIHDEDGDSIVLEEAQMSS